MTTNDIVEAMMHGTTSQLFFDSLSKYDPTDLTKLMKTAKKYIH